MMRKIESVLVPVVIVALFALAVGVLWMSKQRADVVAAPDVDQPAMNSPVATAAPVDRIEGAVSSDGPSGVRPSTATLEARPRMAPMAASPLPLPAFS